MHSYQGISITFDEMGKKNGKRAQLGLKSLTKSIEFVWKEIEDFFVVDIIQYFYTHLAASVFIRNFTS